MKKTKSLILSFIVLLVLSIATLGFLSVKAATQFKVSVKAGSEELIKFEKGKIGDNDENTDIVFTIEKGKIDAKKKVSKVLAGANELKEEKGKYTHKLVADVEFEVQLVDKEKATFKLDDKFKKHFKFADEKFLEKEHLEGEQVSFTIVEIEKGKKVEKVFVGDNEIRLKDGKYTFETKAGENELKVSFVDDKAQNEKQKMSGTTIAAIVILVVAILVPAIMAIVKKVQVAKAEKQGQDEVEETPTVEDAKPEENTEEETKQEENTEEETK